MAIMMLKFSFNSLTPLQIPGFMVLSLVAFEKQSKTNKLDGILPSQGTIKSRLILFTDDEVNRYFSRGMSDPNFMALAITVSEKQGSTR